MDWDEGGGNAGVGWTSYLGFSHQRPNEAIHTRPEYPSPT